MNSVYMYHPLFWDHLKRMAITHPEMDQNVTDKILNFKTYDKEHDPLFWITRMLVGSSGVDRTGKYNAFKTEYDPIPSTDGFNKSFSTICLETAEKLWKDNDTIEVSWSGGIDSTAVALALMETKPADKKLIIGCSKFSIDEYPAFYETHKDICKLLTTEEFFSKDRLESAHLIVTGDVGDQIWGANLAVLLDEEELFKKDEPWQVMIDWPDVFKQSKLKSFQSDHPVKQPWTKSQKDKFIEVLTDHISSCPFEIKTCFDMAWWLNFSTKINYVRLRMPMIATHDNKLSYINLNNFRPFYLTDDFQRWSIVNHNEKISSFKSSYKQGAKDFIFSINKDANYATHKQKEPSTPKMLDSKWFSRHRADVDANYVIMADGTAYNNRSDMPISIIEDILGNQQ